MGSRCIDTFARRCTTTNPPAFSASAFMSVQETSKERLVVVSVVVWSTGRRAAAERGGLFNFKIMCKRSRAMAHCVPYDHEGNQRWAIKHGIDARILLVTAIL